MFVAGALLTIICVIALAYGARWAFRTSRKAWRGRPSVWTLVEEASLLNTSTTQRPLGPSNSTNRVIGFFAVKRGTKVYLHIYADPRSENFEAELPEARAQADQKVKTMNLGGKH